MSSKNNTYLHGSIYFAGAFVIIHHIIRLVTNLLYLNVNFEAGTIYNIVLGVLMIGIIILILLKSRYGVYAFFIIQILNAIILSIWQGSWPVHLAASVFFSCVVAAFLCLKKDGVAGWVAIFGSKEDIENASSEKQKKALTKSAQELEIIPPTPEPIVNLPVQETIAIHEDRTPKRAKYKFIIYSALAVVGIALLGLALYFVIPSKNRIVEQQDSKEETIEKEPVIGKFIYVDKAMVLHTKNGCKAVFKYNNTQTVTPVEPQCLSHTHLAKVCSQCVSEKQIECLKDTFDKYLDAYVNVGKIYRALEEYEGIPPILEFRMRMREYEYARNIYEGMKEDGADVGTFEEFINWIGLSKHAKKKIEW